MEQSVKQGWNVAWYWYWWMDGLDIDWCFPNTVCPIIQCRTFKGLQCSIHHRFIHRYERASISDISSSVIKWLWGIVFISTQGLWDPPAETKAKVSQEVSYEEAFGQQFLSRQAYICYNNTIIIVRATYFIALNPHWKLFSAKWPRWIICADDELKLIWQIRAATIYLLTFSIGWLCTGLQLHSYSLMQDTLWICQFSFAPETFSDHKT